MTIIHAAEITPLGTIGQGTGLGPFANPKDGTGAVTNITTAISGIIGFLTVVAGIWLFIQLIIGGLSWMSAAGDKNKLNEARDRITNALLGLLVIVAAWAILAIAGQFFGWKEILYPSTLIDTIKFK